MSQPICVMCDGKVIRIRLVTRKQKQGNWAREKKNLKKEMQKMGPCKIVAKKIS